MNGKKIDKDINKEEWKSVATMKGESNDFQTKVFSFFLIHF